MEELWPGPLTLVFRASPCLPRRLTGETGTIGIRYPNHPFCLELLKLCNKPITSTSANISGEGESVSIEEITETFQANVDLVIDAGDLHSALPSTIVDVTEPVPRLLRTGAFPIEKLKPYLS
jgi:L-threonylcarbamoyladenylate synthase